MNVFDILGPVMIGPSSSHTAGAVRIGRVARALLGCEPVSAQILLHGSFAKTYKGHGTDKALVGGLLGVDRGVPEVWGSVYDVRDLLNAAVKLRDGKKITDLNLGLKERLALKEALKAIAGSDAEKLMREYHVI